MEIYFKTKKLKRTFNDFNSLSRAYGKRQANKIIQRMDELKAAETLNDISFLPPARLHKLSGKRKDELAVDLTHPFRLVFIPCAGNMEDYSTITEIMICEVIDYH